MIDLHSHILPGVDDGAPDLETSLAMARMAVADGISVMACTPHFMPGLYDNESADIRKRVAALNQLFEEQGIDLALVTGADAHVRPDFVARLRDDAILSLNDSRYVLFEPPHTSFPRNLADVLHNIQVAGYVPIFTHPERYPWLDKHYQLVRELAESGVWLQVTAGSLTGRFGQRARSAAERLLADGLVAILATDAHNASSRPPLLGEARDAAALLVGADEAHRLVVTRPLAVLENRPVDEVEAPQARPTQPVNLKPSLLKRLFGV